jgi:translation initiation factor 6
VVRTWFGAGIVIADWTAYAGLDTTATELISLDISWQDAKQSHIINEMRVSLINLCV